MAWQQEELLILTKTYPIPSSKYRETTCVAAVNASGALRRVYPVPFRLLDGQAQFKKWEWITGNLTKARGDARPESHKIDVDSIRRTERIINTRNEWTERKEWLLPHVLPNIFALEEKRQASGETLGVLHPTRLVGLDITPQKEADWTAAEKVKLTQDALFDTDEVRARIPLRKVPYNFHYRYECEGPNGPEIKRHLILD